MKTPNVLSFVDKFLTRTWTFKIVSLVLRALLELKASKKTPLSIKESAKVCSSSLLDLGTQKFS